MILLGLFAFPSLPGFNQSLKNDRSAIYLADESLTQRSIDFSER